MSEFASEKELAAYRAAHRLGYLIGSAQNIVDYFDNPLREKLPIPAVFIESLRKAIEEAKK